MPDFAAMAIGVAQHVFAAAIGVMLLASGIAKQLRPDSWRDALAGYALPVPAAERLIAKSLPIAEMAIGGSALLALRPALSILLAAALLTLFAIAMVIAILTGRAGIACGCGADAAATISWSRIFRNVALSGLLIISASWWQPLPWVIALQCSLLACLAALLVHSYRVLESLGPRGRPSTDPIGR